MKHLDVAKAAVECVVLWYKYIVFRSILGAVACLSPGMYKLTKTNLKIKSLVPGLGMGGGDS